MNVDDYSIIKINPYNKLNLISPSFYNLQREADRQDMKNELQYLINEVNDLIMNSDNHLYRKFLNKLNVKILKVKNKLKRREVDNDHSLFFSKKKKYDNIVHLNNRSDIDHLLSLFITENGAIPNNPEIINGMVEERKDFTYYTDKDIFIYKLYENIIEIKKSRSIFVK